LIAEDVFTTGNSTIETVKELEDMAGMIGAACIADPERKIATCVPVYAALKLSIETPMNRTNCRLPRGQDKLEKTRLREMPAAK
jgi:orotate phosphoribosyltransferase